ncbi:hypothetical protein [Devosia sp. WQ 349K1]|uniref:hypothetical protein n=1 Tax=Devosia sp. WQ 349K1 TaxID=2800329 RepID=UPI0019068DC3|nr:hypothetical protein [Devosia sp. WQ 349K1]
MHLDGQARVVGMDTMSGVAAIAMLLAGPAAQRAYVRQYSTLFDVELDDFFARVDQVQFGNCDECRAALIATVSAYLDDGDRRAIFRAGEKLGNELVSRPDIRRAIGNLATALVEARSLTGAEARLIIDEYVKFGGHARA